MAPLASLLSMVLSTGVLPAVPFAPDERMEYSVRYLGMQVGRGRISVGHPEGPILPVFLETRTTGVVGVITIRQQLASYLDSATGLPRSSSLDGTEGDYRHVITAQYDRAAGKATVRQRGKFDNTYVLDVPPDTLDFVAMVFRLRTLPLEPGARHEFDVLSGRKVHHIAAEVTGRETVETRMGKFSALKVRVPTTFTGKFSEKKPTHVWFSDDERRAVVQIETDFAIGHAKAVLTAYQPGQRRE